MAYVNYDYDHGKYVSGDILSCDLLSVREKMIYIYLSSKPDGWDFSTERIALSFKETEKTIRTGLQELEKLGLLERERQPNRRMVYILHNFREWLGKNYPGKIYRGKSCRSKKNNSFSTKNHNSKNSKVSASGDTRPLFNADECSGEKGETEDPKFTEAWEAYGKKKNKRQAYLAWKKLTPKQRKQAAKSIPTFINQTEYENPKYRPMFSTYLNDHRWEDEMEKVEDKPMSNAERVKLQKDRKRYRKWLEEHGPDNHAVIKLKAELEKKGIEL